jgi:hypothetical protein
MFCKEVLKCVEEAKKKGYTVRTGTYATENFGAPGNCCAIGAISLCHDDSNNFHAYTDRRYRNRQTAVALSTVHLIKKVPFTRKSAIALAVDHLEDGFESGYSTYNYDYGTPAKRLGRYIYEHRND